MFTKILIANRGEIALRILRASRDLGIASVAVYADDDAHALHVAGADQAVALLATGAAAYLDVPRLIRIALETGCDAVHPGYGFLSERADFAQACADAGICFIGPDIAHLDVFGDKAKARSLAQACAVPLIPGTGAVTLEQAQAFFAAQAGGQGLMIKAIGGGGGRGMRVVQDAAELPEAYARCVSEAHSAFGVDSVYLERLISRARHIEIQIAGDGSQVIALGDRECTLQRRFQKLVEIAPSPSLSAELRLRITAAALNLARRVNYRSLGTFEFLVDETSSELPFVFIEANPRLQVEHTVTEEVTGIDLVQLQIRIAAGESLAACGLDPAAPPRQQGYAMQLRINAETVDELGNARATAGSLQRFDLPSGPGVRVDTHGYAGYTPSPHYDTLLAKLIVSSRSEQFADVVRRARRVLDECRIAGLQTNLPLLRALAARPEFAPHQVHTRFVEQHLAELLQAAAAHADPHAPVLAPTQKQQAMAEEEFDDSLIVLRAPMPAKLVAVNVKVGELVAARAQLAVIEAMKMEHVVLADSAARVLEIRVEQGEFITQQQVLILLEPVAAAATAHAEDRQLDLGHIRPDLQKLLDRQAYTLDANRPAAVSKRHAQGGRTARENIADLCDADSFIEYGALAIAAQTRRRSTEDLIANTPADGMVTGLGSINARHFGAENSRCAVLAYDYTVLAGTQGMRNHHKTDRMLALAHQLKVPVVLFAEGGGGRPGDTDMPIVAGLNNHTFSQFAALSGKVPVVGIVHGRCFAGNAA
ncbi:MAG: biotin carboxylase N-terminal domain-containing protein, partial [Pseudomonadota bacterium]